MKKLISIFLILALAFSVAACGKKVENNEETLNDPIVETDKGEDKNDSGKEDEPTKNEEVSPSETPSVKPGGESANQSSKPENVQKPEANEEQPVQKPAPEPAPESTPSTLGYSLLADFKAKASSMGVEALADALLKNPAIAFSGASMPVSEGFLSGFGNTEIKGFKEGAMFAPMIGSIPFVGYVFELDSEDAVPSFINTLKSSADLRWNICVEADEMVAGSMGKKVFFVMAPFSLED